jgi:hypothetical protein
VLSRQEAVLRKFVLIFTTFAVIVGALVLSTQYITLSIKQSGSETVSIDLADAEAVDMLVDVVAGNITLTGNATRLLDGVIQYELPSSKAAVNYTVQDGTGLLSVTQPDDAGSPVSADGYSYDMQLNNQVPITLQVQTNLGTTDLELAGLSLSRLDASLGNGDDVINLSGAYPDLSYLILNSGQGQDTAVLDCDCASLTNVVLGLDTEADSVTMDGSYSRLVSLNVDSGAGDDSIILDGDYPTMSSMTMNLGSGSDHLVVAGNYPSLRAFVVNVGIGDDVVDLSQSWQNSADIIIISELDSTSLVLPDDVGVSVQVVGRTPTINVEGLTQQGDVYVNDLFGESEIELNIILNTSSVEGVNLSVDGES